MLYRYYCPMCDHEQDETHGMNEKPVIKCHCNAQMRKKIQVAEVIFKGIGWADKKSHSKGIDKDTWKELKDMRDKPYTPEQREKKFKKLGLKD